jgi:DNA (cytosine-5)-methyltransferase 1
MKLKLLDLFSGIGGFSLGLESTGFFETIGFVEKDKFCQKVLKKHWSNINIEEDIRNVRGERYTADIITGGFPCQPFSVAGKRKSTADDRYLWDEMFRIIKEVKPRWIIGENVEGIVNINNGMVLRQVLNDLENEGFQSQCIIIPASGIGAWHQRKRIWIVGTNVENSYSRGRCWKKGIRKDDNIGSTAEKQNSNIKSSNKRCESGNNKVSINVSNSNDNGSYRSQGNATKQSRHEQKDRLSFGDDKDVSNSNARFSFRENKKVQTRRNAINNGSENVSNANSLGYAGWSSERCTDREWSFFQREQERYKMGSEVKGCNRDVSNSNNKGLQRFNTEQLTSKQKLRFTSSKDDEERKTWWQTQSQFCGVPNGVSYELDKGRLNRIKSLGNSIVPQIAREIGLAILKAELNGKI